MAAVGGTRRLYTVHVKSVRWRAPANCNTRWSVVLVAFEISIVIRSERDQRASVIATDGCR